MLAGWLAGCVSISMPLHRKHAPPPHMHMHRRRGVVALFAHTITHTRSTVLMSLECVLIDCTLLCGVTHENRYTVIVDLPQDLLARKSACVRTYLPNNGLHMVLLHLSPMAGRCDRPVAQDRQPHTAVIGSFDPNEMKSCPSASTHTCEASAIILCTQITRSFVHRTFGVTANKNNVVATVRWLGWVHACVHACVRLLVHRLSFEKRLVTHLRKKIANIHDL